MMSGMNVFSFLAIPFFVFSGELMLHGGVADKIVAPRQECRRPHPRRARHVQRRRVHAVRRRLRLGGGRRVGDGRGDDPDDEEGGLSRRLRGQRDDARGAGRRADADEPQHDHLRAGSRRRGVDRRADRGGPAAGGRADGLHAGGRLPRRGQARLPGGHVPGLERRRPGRRSRRARIADRRHHPGGHPVGRLHRDRGRGGRGDLHDPADVLRLPHDDLGALPEGGGEGGEDDRRRAAADRRVGDVPVPDGALRGGRFHGRAGRARSRPRRGWCSCSST